MPSAWLGHAPFAYWLISVLKPRNVVELGVHSGFSYLTFCQAVRALQLDCTCSGIDTWRGDEHAGFYGDDVYDRLAADHLRYADFSQLIRSTFETALPEFADGSIDLLHIDGRHHYEDVRADFESWKPKLSSRAVVLFHDTNEPSFGVGKLWEELCEIYPHFEFLHSHGLGVLGYGSDGSLKLNQLFATSNIQSTSDSIRTMYERLGESVSDQQKIAELEQQLRLYGTSTSWRVTGPLRAASRWSQYVSDRAQVLIKAISG
jgi:hypothetical protein